MSDAPLVSPPGPSDALNGTADLQRCFLMPKKTQEITITYGSDLILADGISASPRP